MVARYIGTEKNMLTSTRLVRKNIKRATATPIRNALRHTTHNQTVMTNSITAKEILSQRFGEEGTERRAKFKKAAFAYYFREILKARRTGEG